MRTTIPYTTEELKRKFPVLVVDSATVLKNLTGGEILRVVRNREDNPLNQPGREKKLFDSTYVLGTKSPPPEQHSLRNDWARYIVQNNALTC